MVKFTLKLPNYGNVTQAIEQLIANTATMNIGFEIMERLDEFVEHMNISRGAVTKTRVQKAPNKKFPSVDFHMIPFVHALFTSNHYVGMLVNMRSGMIHPFFHANCDSYAEYTKQRDKALEVAARYADRCV